MGIHRPPNAVVLLTGSELTQGTTHDRNGPFVAQALHRLGIVVDAIELVPDDPTLLRQAFARASQAADLVIISGGLGPTADDHTVTVLAATFGRTIVREPIAETRMRERALKRYGREELIPENFFKQAEVVSDSMPLANTTGLAPGFYFDAGRALIASLPGVPHELRTMLVDELLPIVRQRFDCTPPRVLRAMVLGHGESAVEVRVQRLGIPAELEYGISARAGAILLKLIAHRPQAYGLLDDFRTRLEADLGDDVIVATSPVGDPGELDLVHVVHERLLSARATVGTAESCTGGLIGKYLTDRAGSSLYYRGTIVVYHDELKTALLDVSRAVLATHGAVSEEVCRAMAVGARVRLGTDYTLAVTGIAGPDGGSEDKPVGTVFIGIAGPGSSDPIVSRLNLPGDRTHVREQTAMRALDLLRRHIGP